MENILTTIFGIERPKNPDPAESFIYNSQLYELLDASDEVREAVLLEFVDFNSGMLWTKTNKCSLRFTYGTNCSDANDAYANYRDSFIEILLQHPFETWDNKIWTMVECEARKRIHYESTDLNCTLKTKLCNYKDNKPERYQVSDEAITNYEVSSEGNPEMAFQKQLIQDYAEKLEDAYKLLRPIEREVIQYRNVGLSSSEVAQILELSEANERKIYSRGIKKMRKFAYELFDEADIEDISYALAM